MGFAYHPREMCIFDITKMSPNLEQFFLELPRRMSGLFSFSSDFFPSIDVAIGRLSVFPLICGISSEMDTDFRIDGSVQSVTRVSDTLLFGDGHFWF